MRIPRFFLNGRDLESLEKCCNNQADMHLRVLEADLIHRMRTVLRLRSGDKVSVLGTDHRVYVCSIEDVTRDGIDLRIERVLDATGELPVNVTVAQSVIKGDRFDWCLEKLTELGVSNIVPLLPERGVVRPGGAAERGRNSRTDNKLTRWKAIVREAAEQSERAKPPLVFEPEESRIYLSNPLEGSRHMRYICIERTGAPLLVTVLGSDLVSDATSGAIDMNAKPNNFGIESISIVIGPEGGFTFDELTTAESHGWKPVSLGSRILRSETAALSAMAQIASLLDC
jgi:16S rRNA (uracil1498-N3)-methyltransferase